MPSPAVVVLVDPLYGGNVGSVIRVMANFNISELRLVRPAPGLLDDPMLKPMAREGGLHILDGIGIHATLDEALIDVDLALGFTNRIGKKRTDSFLLREAIQQIGEAQAGARVAGVFGSENKGLTTADLEKCHWQVKIPTAPGLTSLNLSQAVALFAYEYHLGELAAEGQPSARRNVASVPELEGFYNHLSRVLERIGFIEEASPARMMNQMRRIVSRRLPDPRDVKMLRGVLAKVELALDRAARGLPMRRDEGRK